MNCSAKFLILSLPSRPYHLSLLVGLLDYIPCPRKACCSHVIVSRPTLTSPHDGINCRTSLITSSLVLQQFFTCLVRLIWMALEVRIKGPYSYCFVGYCYFQDLFNVARNILLLFVNVDVVHPSTACVTRKLSKIPKRDFIFARVKTGQVGT